MREIDGELVLSPTDVVDHLSCVHLTRLKLEAMRGGVPRPSETNEMNHLVRGLGLAHERRHLDALRDSGHEVVVISESGSLGDRAQATRDAMRAGAEVIFQATFFDGRWSGHADFCYRVDGASLLGGHHYEPADTKLARTLKVPALVQLADYAAQMIPVQGVAPAEVHVELGDGTRASYRLGELAPFHRRARSRLEAFLDAPADTYPERVAHCAVCDWAPICDARREADDHPVRVAGLRAGQATRLGEVGITTMSTLATADSGQRPEHLGEAAFARLVRQARLQHADVEPGQVELLDPTEHPHGGFHLLPEPDEHDLFFDLEGDPHVGRHGLEYLWGLSDADDRYRAWWALTDADEKATFEAVVDHLKAHLDDHPEAHVYHYASYEVAVLRRLAARYATREAEVDRFLREDRLVDLYAVVRGAVATSRPGYGMKELEHIYWHRRDTEVTGGSESIIVFERWRNDPDANSHMLDELREYNCDDCRSTRALRGWLETLRADAEAQHGAIERPVVDAVELSDQRVAADEAAARLADLLLDGVPDDRDERTPTQQRDWMLAHLLEWHRRENRPEWWAYFERLAMSPDELVDDPDSIAGLAFVATLGRVGRSQIDRYDFDPSQEYKLKVGDQVIDPGEEKSAGIVEALDPIRGRIDLRRGPSVVERGHPRAVIPGAPFGVGPLADAVRVVAEAVVSGARRGRALCDLLEHAPPRVAGATVPARLEGESSSDAVVRLGRSLDAGYLAVQGPPGSGKTYTGARLVAALVADGERVGVCANSHRAIENMLAEVAVAGPDLCVIKAGGNEADQPPGVRWEPSNTAAAERWNDAGDPPDVLGGTVYLFARDDVEVDVLVVDEAGQFGLGHLAAAARAADNLVLLGDPAQLDQPTRAQHPPGLARSALAHVLDDEATMPRERGVFLDETWRLHPALCEVVSELSYAGRLRARPDAADRSIDGAVPGVVWTPVHHVGNRSRSREEALRVRELFDDLVGRTFVDGGTRRWLFSEDVLVIAPFNAHVRELASALPEGARVGTVDRFQGQQAPVVIYSMGSSSAEDAPRGIGFLFHRNRLNVALSRAQVQAIVVASPALLDAIPRRPGQIGLVSAMCRIAEGGRSR